MFSSSTEKLEHKIKELNAIKAEYRQELEEAEKQYKKGDIDKAHLDRVRARTEEHLERINEKIRVTRDKLADKR
jgi:predicted  nucleic acid-binding Zn-ribbon protein